MACDICGKKGTPLETLNEGYKTEDIQQICRGCSKLLNDHLWKVRRVTDGMAKTLIKRYISNKRDDNLVTVNNKGELK